MALFEEKNSIINTNINKLNKVITSSLEKRIAHIVDKADGIISTDTDESRAEYLAELKNSNTNIDCIEENKKYLYAIEKNIALHDRLYAIETLATEDKLVFEKTKNNIENTPNIVVYLKNSLTDIAYRNFSEILSDARAVYKESFPDVCEEVYYSRSQYCILPIENYEDGRMVGFINMIRKYELKIVLTCNVESANGKITKFALLKRELMRLDCPEKVKEYDYVEIGVILGKSQKLHEVLESALYFGYNLYKIDSLPMQYSENEYYFDIVFSGNGNLEKLICWLEFEVPRYEILGIYTQIKSIEK